MNAGDFKPGDAVRGADGRAGRVISVIDGTVHAEFYRKNAGTGEREPEGVLYRECSGHLVTRMMRPLKELKLI